MVDKKVQAKAKAAVTKAKTAAKAALAGANNRRQRKIRVRPTFYRPKTQIQARKPRYPRRSVPKKQSLDKFAIVQYPLTTESAMKKIEDNNTLVFIVDKRANKFQIKAAVKDLYDIDVAKVNTLIRPDGHKKAFVHLAQDHDALEVANKIGII
ncbi:ribosomal protein L23a [Salpingoeca rosetta]|uniref:Ribosomal protein L23a n=1 Tax=Salpingoeca rosetta (strain ATCC 50818 / BSB-021) TaxID=946362 RepID=F2TY61_SALR5|nr:ribosomal protein L23a [Salpingoeca rosetta]EGD76320.1 ribosomal protein L23a [Salpingoeca rosetta]|eukprot:XP_004998495.1 ribosomal protein L23a [Salpingoeca rosetta]